MFYNEHISEIKIIKEAEEFEKLGLDSNRLWGKEYLENLKQKHKDKIICVWSCNEDEYGTYLTQCGHCFECTTDGIKENRFKFCPFCGKSIEEEITKNDDE